MKPWPHPGGDVGIHRYRITVAGVLGETARAWFGDFQTEPVGGNTALIGDLDQADLFGALNRILALGLELVEVTRLENGNS
jgi:hypothetical protein